MKILKTTDHTDKLRVLSQDGIIDTIKALQALHTSLDAKHYTCESFELQCDYSVKIYDRFESFFVNFRKMNDRLFNINAIDLKEYFESKNEVQNENE